MRVKVRGRAAVMALCVDRLGYRDGWRVAEFVTEWEMAVRSFGRPITVKEFTEWWRDSPATVFRRLESFRGAFQELGPKALPQDLMAPLLRRLEAKESVERLDVGAWVEVAA